MKKIFEKLFVAVLAASLFLSAFPFTVLAGDSSEPQTITETAAGEQTEIIDGSNALSAAAKGEDSICDRYGHGFNGWDYYYDVYEYGFFDVLVCNNCGERLYYPEGTLVRNGYGVYPDDAVEHANQHYANDEWCSFSPSIEMNYDDVTYLGIFKNNCQGSEIVFAYAVCRDCGYITYGEENTGGQEQDVETIFNDVKSTDWFADSVLFVFNQCIMTGMGGTDNFAPYEPLSRAQLAVMLWRLANIPQTEYAPIFPDVPDGEWYSKQVIWAYNNGIITGYQNGYFGPADNVTREQLAIMLYRFTEAYRGLDVSNKADISGFTDAASVSSWAREAIEWAVGNGIITGKDNGARIDPQGNATRCECAAMFQRFIEKYGR